MSGVSARRREHLKLTAVGYIPADLSSSSGGHADGGLWIVLVFLPLFLLIDLPEQQAAGSPYVLFHADYSAWNRT